MRPDCTCTPCHPQASPLYHEAHCAARIWMEALPQEDFIREGLTYDESNEVLNRRFAAGVDRS